MQDSHNIQNSFTDEAENLNHQSDTQVQKQQEPVKTFRKYNPETKSTNNNNIDVSITLFKAEDESAPKSTFLDSDDDNHELPLASWGDMKKNNIHLSAADRIEEDDTEDEQIQKENAPQLIPSKVRRKKRSPNRQDSDSDEDSDKKAIDTESPISEGGGIIDVNYNLLEDDEYIKNGFKVGFSEDRNKKFRRSMEVFLD